MFDPGNPLGSVSAWTTAWYLVTSCVSFFVGAWVAARVSASPVRHNGVVHGLATWGLASLWTLGIFTVLGWGFLSQTAGVLRAAILASALEAPAVAHTAAGSAASLMAGLFLRIWVGVVLAFIAAIAGGAAGRTPLASTEAPAPGERRAA